MVVEGAAGITLACAIKYREQFAGKKIGIVLCGANITEAKFNEAMKMDEAYEEL